MQAIFDDGPPPPCPAPFNLARHVLRFSDPDPGKIALAVVAPTGAERWSYGRLEAAVRGTAAGLLSEGLAPGDRVLLRLGNTVEFPIAFLGAIAAGLVPVPTSAQLTAPEVEAIARHLEPAAILHDPRVASYDTETRTYDLQRMRGWHGAAPAEYAMGDPDRLAYIVMTSGTSGRPRAVGHAHRAVWARQMMMDGWYGLGPSDRLLHAGAFNWTYTLGTGLLDPWTRGATALIPAEGVTPAQLPLLLARHEASIFAAAPGIYRQMLRHDMSSLPKLRHGLSAGEKMAEPVREAWRSVTGTEVHEAYGMSECSTFISAAPGRPAPAGTLGYPQPGRRVAILGPDGPAQIGEPGEIAIHRSDPGLMLGYVGDPAATTEKMRGEWFVTGDQGLMGETGAVTFLGRADDLMNAGGLRVSPLEVEAAILGHPGVEEAGVTDIEIREGVRIIAAFWTGPEAVPDADLAAWIEPRLAAYKRPRIWVRLDALPKGGNGKLIRRELGALAPR